MSVAMSRRKLSARHAQAIVCQRAIGADYPAREDREPSLGVLGLHLIEVKPLTTRVGTGELLG